MKKFYILAAVLALTLSVLVGCGCRRRDPAMNPTDNATLMPTTAITEAPTTIPVTEEATTAATDNTSVPTETTDMIPGGMDPDNNTTGTDATIEGNTRHRSANRK